MANKGDVTMCGCFHEFPFVDNYVWWPLVVLAMSFAGVCGFFMVWSAADFAILRKHFLSGRFSLRTLFAVTALAALESFAYRTFALHEREWFEQIATVIGISIVCYINYISITIWTREMLDAEMLSKKRRRLFPPTICFATPNQTTRFTRTSVNSDLSTVFDVTAPVETGERFVENGRQNLVAENIASQFTGSPTTIVHPT